MYGTFEHEFKASGSLLLHVYGGQISSVTEITIDSF